MPIKTIAAAKETPTFEEINGRSPGLRFTAFRRPTTGPPPRPNYEIREIVTAIGQDGTVYEALCGRYDPSKVWPGLGESSTNANPRQRYATHLGYGFNPADVFIGKREAGKVKTSLFFRDVGSHETAPHYIATDSEGNIHLIVSDVNMSDNNELNVYSLIGDPRTGKWTDAALLDVRGFTSWSHPWAGKWSDTVHLMWDWGDATYEKQNPNMGLFYVDWTPQGYGRKTRVISGLIESYDAAIDSQSGLMLVVADRDDGVFVSSRSADGRWTQATRLDSSLSSRDDVSVESIGSNKFAVRVGGGSKDEFVVTPE